MPGAWKRRVVVLLESEVFIEVPYGYTMYSLVDKSQLENVGGFGNVGSDEDDQLVGETEKYRHLYTERSSVRMKNIGGKVVKAGCF